MNFDLVIRKIVDRDGARRVRYAVDPFPGSKRPTREEMIRALAETLAHIAESSDESPE